MKSDYLICTRNGLAFFLLMFSSVLHAQSENLSVVKMEKLRKAAILAERVVVKAKDYAGAIRVLEEAGAKEVAANQPANYPVGEYAKLLYVYAKCLFHLKDRYSEAGPVLQRVLSLKPDNYKANFLYGDFNYRKYKQENKPSYRKKAEQYYSRYLELLKKNQLTTAVPMRVVQVLYGDFQGGVCNLLAKKASEGKVYELHDFFNPETQLELLENLPGGDVAKLEAGETFRNFATSEGGVISRSQIDIDNDGEKETRYSKRLQPSNCMQNLFYKKDEASGKNKLIKNTFIGRYFKPGLFCGNSSLSFVEYDKQVFLLEKQVVGLDSEKYGLYKYEPNGSWENLCNFDYGGQQAAKVYKLDSTCEFEVCKHIVGKANKIIEAQGKSGIEKLLRDKTSLESKRQALGQDLQQYINSRYIYEADIDNDGLNELMARLWVKDELGNTSYQYRLFKQDQQKQWHLLTLPGVTNDFWFFVEAYKGINYIVGFEMFKTRDQENKEYMAYRLKVYYLQGGQFQTLGEIALSDR